MEDAREDPTTFTAQSLPSDPRLLATVTNAYLGTRVYRETLHVSGVYNGAGGGAHRAILPNPLNVKMEAPAGTGEQAAETFALDTNTGSCTGWPLPASACFSGLSLLPPTVGGLLGPVQPWLQDRAVRLEDVSTLLWGEATRDLRDTLPLREAQELRGPGPRHWEATAWRPAWGRCLPP